MDLVNGNNKVFEYNLHDYIDIEKFVTDNEYAEQFKDYLIKKDNYDSNLILIKYNKENINVDNFNTLGRFRSLIYDKNKKEVISYFPAKSESASNMVNNDENYMFEEFFEGTMINMFWYDVIDDWEITTRSNIGAKCSYKPDGINFRVLFLETLNKLQWEFENYDKNFCYTFVLQHNKNRIVTPVNKNRLILVDVATCKKNTICRFSRTGLNKVIDNIIKNNNYYLPEQWKMKYTDMKTNLDKAPYFFMGYVLHDEISGERIKFRNESYEYVRHLKGNNPKIQYRYYHLRNNNLVKDYLNYYPEDSKTFSGLRNNLHKYTKALYQCYISCYIKKEKELRLYDYKYKTHMYYLHEIYKNELKDEGGYINMNEVIKYVNSLEPPRLMHVINSDLRVKEKEMNKIDVEQETTI
tara:strand:- start:14493 stop:15722 length:1230 start_codon:yes stop_codon:yes gene_type:complete